MTKPSLLLMEDEVLVAMMMEDELTDLGWDVAGSFAEVRPALDWLAARAEGLTAAILDINLNGEMVFPVAAALKARGTPFLFLTGYTSPVGAEVFEAPILNKPFDAPHLEATLRRLIEGGGAA